MTGVVGGRGRVVGTPWLREITSFQLDGAAEDERRIRWWQHGHMYLNSVGADEDGEMAKVIYQQRSRRDVGWKRGESLYGPIESTARHSVEQP